MKTQAQSRATQKYESKSYDKVLLRIRKDKEPTRETITKLAESKGESLNGFIMKAIEERIQKG